jgi:integrase
VKLRLDPARLDFSESMLDEASPRGRHLSPAVFAAIGASLDPGRRALFEFCSITGKRKGQMSCTTWPHYDATQEEFAWTAAEVKAKHAEVLPLAGRALEIITELHAVRRLHCRYVFHGPDCGHRPPSQRYGCVGDFKRLWKTACTAAGVAAGRKRGGFVFHNTRHTAITNLVNEGTPAHEAMAISGHRTRSVFDRYSLPLKAQTRAALERVSGHTLGHTPGEIPTNIRGHRRAKSARS